MCYICPRIAGHVESTPTLYEVLQVSDHRVIRGCTATTTNVDRRIRLIGLWIGQVSDLNQRIVHADLVQAILDRITRLHHRDIDVRRLGLGRLAHHCRDFRVAAQNPRIPTLDIFLVARQVPDPQLVHQPLHAVANHDSALACGRQFHGRLCLVRHAIDIQIQAVALGIPDARQMGPLIAGNRRIGAGEVTGSGRRSCELDHRHVRFEFQAKRRLPTLGLTPHQVPRLKPVRRHHPALQRPGRDIESVSTGELSCRQRNGIPIHRQAALNQRTAREYRTGNTPATVGRTHHVDINLIPILEFIIIRIRVTGIGAVQILLVTIRETIVVGVFVVIRVAIQIAVHSTWIGAGPELGQVRKPVTVNINRRISITVKEEIFPPVRNPVAILVFQ